MRTISTLGLVVVALLASAACKSIDQDKAQKAIKEWAEKIGPVSKVSCPKVDAKKGASFECAVTFQEGPVFKVKVDQKDDEGNVEWNWVEQPVGGETAAKMITEGLAEAKPGAVVDCGKGIKALPPEGLECKASAGDENVTLVLKVEDGQWAWNVKE